MSAIAHASAGIFLRGRYEAWLARGMNPLRWVEYAFSSTVMIIAIAYLSFITDVPALVAIAGYGKVGRWKDDLAGEKTYMVLSLVAKSLLARQVWSGTLRPQ
jgi:hypothetical protein